uniref:26S proteasome regulatory subunit N1 n=1 Tax=Heterorhabditis bacteriophora TaxID=37862 RepID=A0A1I7WLB5_HETBA
MSTRQSDFDKARLLAESGKADEALEAIATCSFEEKKDACNVCIDILEGVKLVKENVWMNLYTEAVYDTFSKMNRCARDEEREQVWNRLKEMYYEITLAAKKIWRDKNMPERLTIYVLLAKLCKSYLDVADEESFKMCEAMAREAKFCGKGTLDDEDWKEANRSIELIKKTIADALHERDLLVDSD